MSSNDPEPVPLEGDLLNIWIHAQSRFSATTNTKNISRADKKIFEDPTKWTKWIDTLKQKSTGESHIRDAVGRHVQEVQSALDFLTETFRFVSVAVPIVAPATFVVQAFALAFKTWADARKSLEDIENIFNEVEDTLNGLSVLKDLDLNSNDLKPPKKCLIDIFSCCLEICATVIDNCSDSSVTRQMFNRKSDDELKKLLSQLQMRKQKLDGCLLAKGFVQMNAISQKATRDERLEILQWLSASTFHDRHRQLLDEVPAQSKAGQWLLTSPLFTSWKNTKGSKLWCTGKPGAGKSVLAAIIIRHLNSMSTTNPKPPRVIFIYMTHGQNREVKHLLSIMLGQLVREMEQIPPEIVQDWRKKKSQGEYGKGENTQKPEEELLMKLLSDLTKDRPLYIVLDAMDECCRHDRFPILQRITKINTDTRILVTARRLEGGANLSKDFNELRIEAQDSDIDEFIEEKMKSSIVMSNATSDLKHLIKDTVKRKAGKMFLLAKLHMGAIGDVQIPGEIRGILNELPETVDKTYEQAIARLDDESDRRKRSRIILAWLSYARRPLTPKELGHAIAVHQNEPSLDESHLLTKDDMLSICCGLVETGMDGTLRFIHYSAEHFFQQKKEKEFAEFLYDIPLVCAKYLCNEGLRETHLSQDLEDSFPLAKYAVENFHHHFHFVRDNDRSTKDLFDYTSQLIENAVYYRLLCRFNAYYIPSKALEGEDRSYRFYDIEPSSNASLHIAVFLGCQKQVELLLDKGFPIDGLDDYEQTALIVAFKRNFGDIARILLNRGTTIDLSSKQGHVLLLFAAQRGFNEVVDELLKSARATQKQWNFIDLGVLLLSPLIVLFWTIRIASLWSSPPPSGVDQTPTSKDEEVEFNHNKRLFEDYGVILSMAYDGKASELETFLERWWRPNPETDEDGIREDDSQEEDENSRLCRITYSSYDAEYRRRWRDDSSEESGDEVEAQDYLKTACFLASERGHKQVIEILLRLCKHVNLKDFRGQSLLHRATFRNDISLVKLLIERGARVNAVDENGRTPFTANPWTNHGNVLDCLIENGAEIDHRHRDKTHELYRAAAFGNKEMVECFLKYGVDASITNIYSWAPIHEAAANGHLECVKLLFEHGARPSPISDVGKTPLDLTKSNEPHYDWPCLGDDSEHYLNGVPYKEKERYLQDVARQEEIVVLLESKGAKTADDLYEENRLAFSHVNSRYIPRLGSETDGEDSA